MAETGGWTPENFTIEAGQPLVLKLTSDDVTHGFAVGQTDQPAVDVTPGEITEVTLVFDEPGKYTYYCTRWCSLNHWRMRGTIEVTGTSTNPRPADPPHYVELGLDIDSVHETQVIPSQMPSAWRGALLNRSVPGQYKSREVYLSHTPVELWSALRAEPGMDDLTDQGVWDLVALVWRMSTTDEALQTGRELFASNCAACHGEKGDGQGVFANTFTPKPGSENSTHDLGSEILPPVDFTGQSGMLSASPAHLQGKIIRGGMGTGMPYWGPIFTEDQTWALVAYLWTFQFEQELNSNGSKQ